jgi:hypothetical protein
MKELASHKKRRRADIVAFGPEFRKRVKETRLKLGIPEGGFPKDVRTVLGSPEKGFPEKLSFYPVEANRWYAEHIQKATGRRMEGFPRTLPPYYWYCPREIAELIEDFAYSHQPCRPGFYPEVPLDRYAMDLVREFGLPEDVVNEIKHYILVEERSGFGVPPMLQLIPIPMEGQDGLYFCSLIAGIDGSTTKKEWLGIWQQIKSRMKENGMKIAPIKRDEDKISIRDLTWWKWNQDGLAPKTIAEKWQIKNPQDETYAEDTIRAAIDRINEAMRPVSQNAS